MGFETAIWHFRGATSCFYWASKLLSGTLQLSTAFRCFAMGPPEAPQAVSVGLRNCYLALPKRHKLFLYWASKLLSGTFSAPLKASKPSKPSQQLSTAFRCFAMGPPEAPRAVSVGLRKLLSDTSEAPQAVSIGLRNCYLARFQHPLKASKPSKPSQQLSTAFRCFAHGTSEAPQAVSIGRRKCYLARCSFRRPFAALPWVLPRPHELFLLGFETAIWHFRGATSCFYWASKLLSGTFSAPLKSFKTLKTLPAAFDGHSLLYHGSLPEAPQAVGCFCWASKLLSGTFPKRHLRCFYLASQLAIWHVAAFDGLSLLCPWVLPRPHKLFLLGFETAIWHFRSATSCFYWASKLLSGTFSAPLKTFKGFKTLPAAFDGLSLLCHWVSKLLSGNPRGATSCFYWASKLLSGTFSAPLKPSKALKPSQQLFDGLSLLCHGPSRGPTNCFCWASKLLSGTSEAPQAVSILGFETAIWHVFSTL